MFNNNYMDICNLKIKLSNNAFSPKIINSYLILYNKEIEILEKNSIKIIHTGIFLEILTKKNFDIKLLEVNELINKNLYILNVPGTIDQDYRGEIKIILYNFNQFSVKILNGEKIGKLSFGYHQKIMLTSSHTI